MRSFSRWCCVTSFFHDWKVRFSSRNEPGAEEEAGLVGEREEEQEEALCRGLEAVASITGERGMFRGVKGEANKPNDEFARREKISNTEVVFPVGLYLAADVKRKSAR